MSVQITILQSACACGDQSVETEIKKRAKEAGVDISIATLSDLQETMKYGTTNFPSVVIDEKVYGWDELKEEGELKRLLGEV